MPPTMSKSRDLTRWIGFALGAFLTLLSVAVLRADEREFDEGQFYDLLGSMDRFERKLLGCPSRGYPPEVRCDARRGVVDMVEWREICRKARKLGESR